MIVCFQYKVYERPRYGVPILKLPVAGGEYWFGRPNSFGNPFVMTYGGNLLEPICAWRIKKKK